MLPGAVVNMVGPELRTEQRLESARNLGLDWIDSTWTEHLPSRYARWLVKSSAQFERTVERVR